MVSFELPLRNNNFVFIFLQQVEIASLATDAAKSSPTNIIATNIWNTHGAWTKETGSTPVTFATAPSRSATVCAFTSCTCMRNTDLTSAVNVASGFRNPRAWTSISESTAGKDLTNALTASRLSQLRLFWELTSDSTVVRNRLNAAIVEKLSHRTRRMIATWDAHIQRRSRAFVNFAAKPLHSHTNSNSIWTCTREKNPTPAKSAAEGFQALPLATATGQTSIVPLGKTERRRWCERVLRVTKMNLTSATLSRQRKIYKWTDFCILTCNPRPAVTKSCLKKTHTFCRNIPDSWQNSVA